MIQFILALFKPFRHLIEMMGADYDQFISILKLKLTLDDRRAKGLAKSNSKAHEKMLVKQSFSQIIMGVVFIMILTPIQSLLTYFYFAHLLLMVMMAMMIISEFTSILFDTSENAIIQPLPIKGNTIGLARNAHVFVYLGMMALNLSLPVLVVAMIKFGVLSGLVFLFTVILNVLFTLFLSNILYLGIMRIATGERLKSVLMYFQIAVAIFFMAAYQFGLNIVDKTQLANLVLTINWYSFLIPPAFFSGFIETIVQRNLDFHHAVFVAETFTVPFVAIYVAGKYLNPVFNQKLMDLEQGDKASKVKLGRTQTTIWFRALQALFVYGNEERAAFKLMWKMVGRERNFIQRVLPSIGYIVFMVLFPIFKKGFNFSDLLTSDKFLVVLYAFMFVAMTLPAALLTGNSQHETWLFKSVPLSTPANFFKGCIKAVFARFFVPLYLVVGAAVCALWGIRVLPDVIIVFFTIYMVVLLVYYLQRLSFPFSMEKSTQGGMAILKIFGTIAIIAVLGFSHFALLKYAFRYANLLLIPIYAGIILILNQFFVYRKITWEKVDQVNSYS